MKTLPILSALLLTIALALATSPSPPKRGGEKEPTPARSTVPGNHVILKKCCCGEGPEGPFDCNPCGGCCISTASRVRVGAFSWADDGVRAGWSAADIAFFDATQSLGDQVVPWAACLGPGSPGSNATWVLDTTIAGINVRIMVGKSTAPFGPWTLTVFDLDDPMGFRQWTTRFGVDGDCCGTTGSTAGLYIEYNGDFGSSNRFDAFTGGAWSLENNKCCHCAEQTWPFSSCIKSTKDYCPADGDNECDTESDLEACEALP